MPAIIHYLCARELLPIIEGALAANGYRIDIPRQHGANRITALVMTRGLTTILLTDAADQALAAIEIWGIGQSLAAELLESFPIVLYKPSAISLTALGAAATAAQVG
jgi:hypothetical protein